MGYRTADYVPTADQWQSWMVPGTNTMSPQGQNEYAQAMQRWKSAGDAEQARLKRNVKLVKAGTMITGGLMGAGALGAFGAGAGGASALPSATSGVGTTGGYGGLFGGTGQFLSGASGAAPAVSSATSGMSLGGMMNSPIVGLGVNSLMSYLGNRSNNNANAAALQAQLEASLRAYALQQQQFAEQSRQFNVSQDDSRAALAAQNEQRRREFEAMNEQNAYVRSQSERTSRLEDERQARLSPYRDISMRMLQSLGGMLRS